MSLDWDMKHVANRRELIDHPCPSTHELDGIHPLTHFMIWTMLAIGVREITEKTVDTVYERMNLYQRVTGAALRYHNGDAVYVTEADVRRYIGLTTNVTPKTNIEFYKFLLDMGRNYRLTEKANPGNVTALAFVANRAQQVKDKAVPKGVQELFMESYMAWLGEEESVQTKHAQLIADMRQRAQLEGWLE
jgi:hypothetical protein